MPEEHVKGAGNNSGEAASPQSAIRRPFIDFGLGSREETQGGRSAAAEGTLGKS